MAKPTLGPAASEPRGNALAKAQAARRSQHDRDTVQLLADPTFRRWFWHLVDRTCGVFGPSFDAHGGQMARKEGRRSVGIEVIQHAQRVEPNGYVLALREAIAADDMERKVIGAQETDSE